MNYNKTIEILNVAAKQADSGLRKELKSAIELIKSNSSIEQPIVGENCKYNHNGLCWGQKCTPECTAGYGYCPLVKEAK